MSFEVAKKVLDEVAKKFDASQILICITGGEPLLNKELFKIIDYSSRLDFSCGITTNGTFSTEEVGQVENRFQPLRNQENRSFHRE